MTEFPLTEPSEPKLYTVTQTRTITLEYFANSQQEAIDYFEDDIEKILDSQYLEINEKISTEIEAEEIDDHEQYDEFDDFVDDSGRTVEDYIADNPRQPVLDRKGKALKLKYPKNVVEFPEPERSSPKSDKIIVVEMIWKQADGLFAETPKKAKEVFLHNFNNSKGALFEKFLENVEFEFNEFPPDHSNHQNVKDHFLLNDEDFE
ncbi:MAG: hypothetical protein WCJ64_10390 [Rhodospirillaceae bacterium]